MMMMMMMTMMMTMMTMMMVIATVMVIVMATVMVVMLSMTMLLFYITVKVSKVHNPSRFPVTHRSLSDNLIDDDKWLIR